jgi:hypothetical protein
MGGHAALIVVNDDVNDDEIEGATAPFFLRRCRGSM